ncbi:MAG: DUF3502 domain-containing protein, partial [Oscillospiraceae bacterium]
VSPGEGSAASPIFTSLYDENKKIFKAIDTPEMKDFSLKMKEWNSKGYWSKSAMSSKIGSVESFKNGRSASAFSNLEEINTMYEEFQKDDRKSWDIRAYLVYDKVVTASSSMSEAISISAGTKNKEKALKTIDLLYSDKDLYRLLTYGVSGVHYEEIEPGVKKDLDNVSYPNVFTGIGNQEYDMKGKMTLPEAPRIEDEIKSVYFEDPTVNYRRDLSNFTEIVASLNNVYLKYTAPRMLGFVDDVDAAIAVEKQKLKEAGIDEYVSAVQSQLDKYLADNKN